MSNQMKKMAGGNSRPTELEKRKGVSPEFTTTYWARQGQPVSIL